MNLKKEKNQNNNLMKFVSICSFILTICHNPHHNHHNQRYDYGLQAIN